MIRVRRHPYTAKPTTSTCHQVMGQSGRDSDSEDSNCIYWDRKGLGTGPDVYLHRFGGGFRVAVGVDVTDRTSLQPTSSATAFAATRSSGSRRRRTAELCTGPRRDLAAANVVFPPIARRRGTQVHSSFRRATGYGPPKPGGKHQYQGTNARPVHQQTALHLVHGVYCCCPLLVQKIKILKMDEDGAPSQPPSDCGEGDTSALCAVGQHLADHMVVLGVTHRTAGETPPPPPGLVAQSGAGHGVRTAARLAILLAVQEAAGALEARGRAPGGALQVCHPCGDTPGDVFSQFHPSGRLIQANLAPKTFSAVMGVPPAVEARRGGGGPCSSTDEPIQTEPVSPLDRGKAKVYPRKIKVNLRHAASQLWLQSKRPESRRQGAGMRADVTRWSRSNELTETHQQSGANGRSKLTSARPRRIVDRAWSRLPARMTACRGAGGVDANRCGRKQPGVRMGVRGES
ncbi:hypothetical protein THAOC_06307 [Thalassiosira oceanica]|uniref:Uncharacterized protein n=1 Tax=Thalassiosira oceanica TaxID=159749 RepID=K0T3E8_THAOC|nr:hypothetical protein THAOC_06307 [Thalassiosira oceanica]|eukprot:EJK72185.1 hypothetical protein THAOC_06307 [Thalassiosira oceanica]